MKDLMIEYFMYIVCVCVATLTILSILKVFNYDISMEIYKGKKIYEIRTCEDLKAINNDLDGVYILMNDIDGKDCK